MNEDGLVFSIDSILMLVPIFIIVTTVAGLTLNVPHESPYYSTQDAMEMMLLIGNTSTTNLPSIASNITAGRVNEARTAADITLRPVLNSFRMKYNLTYYNATTGNFVTLINNGTMADANSTVVSSTRMYGNVTFRLYMWG